MADTPSSPPSRSADRSAAGERAVASAAAFARDDQGSFAPEPPQVDRTVRIRGWLAGVLAVALSAAALGFAVWALPLARYEPRPPPTIADESVVVIERNSDLPMAATLQLEWSPSRVVRAVGEGLVTGVLWEPGRSIRCGDPVLEVDGNVVVAHCGPRPLWRDVTGATSGADREEAVTFMRDLGRFADIPGKPTSAQFTEEVRRWQEDLGMQVTGALRPQDLLWIGAPIAPSSATVSVGDQLPADGEVFEVDPVVTSAVVADFETSPPAPARLFGLDGDDQRFELRSDGTVEDLTGLTTAIVGLGLAAEGPPAHAGGTTRLRTPADFLTVPATSLVADSTTTCVITVRSADATLIPVEVAPVMSLVGVVFVSGGLEPGTMVLVNPDRSRGC